MIYLMKVMMLLQQLLLNLLKVYYYKDNVLKVLQHRPRDCRRMRPLKILLICPLNKDRETWVVVEVIMNDIFQDLMPMNH